MLFDGITTLFPAKSVGEAARPRTLETELPLEEIYNASIGQPLYELVYSGRTKPEFVEL